MDQTDDVWTAIRRALPDAEESAAAVAAELGEPVNDVRLSVLIGTIALSGQLGPESAAVAAIEAELARLSGEEVIRLPGRPIAANSLDALLAEARAREVDGSLDLETIVAIQRASGAIAARTDRPMVVLLHRYAVTRRLLWENCVTAMQAGRLDPSLLAAFGRFLLLWNELTSLAVTEGYRTAEREILARTVEARRGALQELLGVIADDPATEARLRRVAVQYGLNPDRAYCLIAIAPRPESDVIPERPDVAEEELEELAGRIGHLLGAMSPSAEGAGTGIRLPAVLPLMGRIVVLARGNWAGLSRVPAVLDTVLGGLAAASLSRAGLRAEAHVEAVPAAWVAVGSQVIDGVGSLAGTYAELVDATRTAQRLDLRGWFPDPEVLALERLLLANPDLADAIVRSELGPLLVDKRFGEELIETLQAYFDAGENVTEAARRLHLATRTVGYRLEKVASLLGYQVDGPNRRRLSTALIVHRLRSVD